MAIKAGAILHDANGYVIDRIQSGGPGQLNIPQEKIYELGNWKSVATITDIPDLTFDLESFDVFSEFEAILLGYGGAAVPGEAAAGGSTQLSGVAGSNEIDFQNHIPIDVVSPFKSRRNNFDIVKGLAVPYLTLERATYRFGLRQNAAQQFTLRGDSIYYVPGQPYYEEFDYTGSNGTEGNPFVLDKAPILYAESGDDVYALCVVLINLDTGDYKRLFWEDSALNPNAGYSDNSDGEVWINEDLTATYDICRIVYASAETGSYDPGNDYQGLNPSGNRIHERVTTKPAAVRPRDIDIYIGTAGASPVYTRMTSVQSVEVTWAANLEMDEEFGSKHYVTMDYFVPDVTGTIGVKPFDPADLWNKLAQITGVSENEVIGPDFTTPVPLKIVINHPDTGDVVKTIFVPDARFNVPGLSGRIQTKLETSFAFTSDQGLMYVYNGEMDELP